MADQTKPTARAPHNVIIEDRKRISVSGISDVDCFDERQIRAYSDLGELLIKGFDLHINKLSVETGELSVEGTVTSVEYSDDKPNKGGAFARLFR